MEEPNLFQSESCREVLERLEGLSPSSPALWGEMDVAQMLAHLGANLEMSLSDEKTYQSVEDDSFGPVAKQHILREGMPKNADGLPELIITDERSFQVERDGLSRWLSRFCAGSLMRQAHPFFGRMTPAEWARLHYLHIDHHFRQFGA